MSDTSYLTGHLLFAMPAMQDPNFHRTVNYICEHSVQGALGIVINRPLDIDLGSVFEQLSLNPSDPSLAQQPVLQGGRYTRNAASCCTRPRTRRHRTLMARSP